MTRSNRRIRLVKYLLLSYLLLAPVVLGLQFILIAHAPPPSTSQSYPTDYTTDLAVTNPTEAYDGNVNTFAEFSRDVDGYFELTGFPGRTGKINGVDFEMECEAEPSSDDKYRILYFVGPSPEEKVLLNWTSSKLERMTHTWSFVEEPNDGVWNKTDVENVRFRVEIDGQGAADDVHFRIYEAWLTLFVNYPVISVDPLELVDPSLTPGEEFTIDIVVDYVDKPSAYQFEMSFNPDVLEGVSVVNGPFLGGAGGIPIVFGSTPQFDNTAGRMNLFGATLDPPDDKNPIGGSEQFGALASVTFRVVGSGVSNLTLGETTALVDTEGGFIVDGETMPVCLKHGYFSNEQHTLTIDSTPIAGVEFTFDGESHVTPFSDDLSEGSYTVVMPTNWTVGEIPYAFLHWEDDSTNPTRIIELTTDKLLTATYIEAGKYKLAIDSAPITGVDFTLDGELYQTPFVNETMPTGSYTIVMPSEWTVDEIPYTFLQWGDGPTSATRVIQLTSNMSLTANYTKPAEYKLTLNSMPISGVEFTFDGESHVTPFSDTLLAGSYTVTMPSEWIVGETTYEFHAWTDLYMQRQRTVALTSNKTLTAMYIFGVERHTLEIDAAAAVYSTPLEGVNFALDGSLETTPFSDELEARKHVIQMPSECEVNATRYWFVKWVGGFTEPTRVVDLTADMSLTAVYANLSVHNINKDTYYEMIQEAIDDADPGDTIDVYPNIYDENLNVDKPLELMGKDAHTTVVDGGGASEVIYVTADDVTISGFTLQNSSWIGIYAEGVTGCTISDNLIADCGDGIGLWICEYNTINNNIVKAFDYPMWLDTSDNNIIYGNAITLGMWEGCLSLWSSNNNTIYGNTFSDSGVGGLVLWDSYDNKIYHNNFLNNALTKTMQNATSSQQNNGWISPGNAYSRDNNYANATTDGANVTYHGFGFTPIEYLWGSVQARITKLEVGVEAFSPDGDDYIQVQTSWNNGIDWTSLLSYIPPITDSNATVYIDVTDGREWTWNELGDGNFLVRIVKRTVGDENVTCVDWLPVRVTSVLQAYDDGDNSWDNGYPSGGNYWSDYTGVDMYSGPDQDERGNDGIGDTPYEIPDTGLDHYPLVEPAAMIFYVVWDGESYPIEITSNSTITAFKFSQPDKQISFNVTGPNGTTGFCEVKFQKDLLDAQPDEWIVLVNGTPVTPDVISGGFWNQLYLEFNHSTQTILIEGETVVDSIPPIADASLTAPLIVDEDTEEVAFDGSASWDDILIKSYTWTFEENGIPTVLAGETIDYTFETPGFYFVTLEVTDSGDNWDTDTVMITVRDITDPVADASETSTTVDEDTPLTLDGSASSDNVGIVEYTWTIEDVPPQTLSGEIQTYTGWVQPGEYSVTLNVTDGAGNWDTDTVMITVRDITDPVADASETSTTVDEDTPLTLDGSASSDNVGIVEYTWTFTDGILKTFTEANPRRNYTFVTPGSYLITLNVSDAAGNWDTDEVNITVVDITGPTADAGPDQTVDEDILVTFNGSASLDNGPIDIIDYTWTFTDDQTTQTLVGMVTNYTFYMPGVYSVTLNVTDAEDNWDIDKIVITVLDVTNPVADAGVDQTVDEGTLVAFNGSASTDNVGVERYTWTFLEGGVLQVLDGENATYEFANPGIYSVTLTVTDAEGNWDTDVIVITVLDIFYPVADAGLDQVVDEDTLVIFDGSGSADNVGIESHNWAFMENGKLRTLMGVNPNYIFVTPGVYLVTLNVTDAAGHSAVDDVQITVRDVTAPVANAGPNSAVDEGTLLTLDGSASSDNVGIVEYTWTFTDETLQTLEGVVTTYTFYTPGVYVVTLNVTDAVGNWAIDTVTISILSGQTSTSSGSLSIWDIVFVSLAGAALGFAIFSFVRRGSKS